MRLYFLNILLKADEARFGRLLNRVRELEPDVVAFVEADGWASGRGEQFAQAFGKEMYVANNPSGLDLAVFAPKGWMTRQAVIGTGQFFHGACRVAVGQPGREPFDLYTVHLNPKGEGRRKAEVTLILDAAAMEGARPALIVGDMNSLRAEDRLGEKAGERRVSEIAADAQSPYWLQDKVPPKAIAQFLAAGWRDVYREREPAANGFTFPADKPAARYDFAFANDAMSPRIRDIRILDTPADVQVSDHLGMILAID